MDWYNQWPDLTPAKRLVHEAENGFKTRVTLANRGACVLPGSLHFAATPMDSRGDVRLAPHPLPQHPSQKKECRTNKDDDRETKKAEVVVVDCVSSSDDEDSLGVTWLTEQIGDASSIPEEPVPEGVNRIGWKEFLRLLDEPQQPHYIPPTEVVVPRFKRKRLATKTSRKFLKVVSITVE
jgi:hypothetical protein